MATQTSFMSGLEESNGRREFIFVQGPFWPESQEYDALRSERFERKGLYRKNRKASNDVVVYHRGQTTGFGSPNSVMLGSIPLDQQEFFDTFETDLHVLEWISALASESPTARLLLKEAQAEGWSVRLDDLAQDGYALDEAGHCIILDHFGFTAIALGQTSSFRNALFINFVKALRQLWHEREGHVFEKDCRPEAVLMLERARSADCEVVALLAGWELRGAGHADIWRFVLGSKESDMAITFVQAIEKDPAGFYDGSVLTRTFCQWYADESRVAMTDHATLERMDELLENAQGACVFGKDRAEPSSIEMLSRLPGGRSYLQGMGGNIANDPYFVSMNDSINESHLFQIVYDSKVTLVEGVPFRDKNLARLIFPEKI